MRPYLQRPSEEDDFIGSLGRVRVFVPGEWDDYIWLYAYDPDADDLPTSEDEPLQCPHCERLARTFRGLTVHLARSHGIKSERADYFATRKES